MIPTIIKIVADWNEKSIEIDTIENEIAPPPPPPIIYFLFIEITLIPVSGGETSSWVLLIIADSI